VKTSLSKMLNILDVFGPDTLLLNVEDLAVKMNISRATAYRYVKELCDSGLLTKVEGSYSLGPRIIQLDWMMRQYDPLISIARNLMIKMVERTHLSVFISVLYDGKIINTHIESNNKSDGFTFGRGRPLPIFKGAQSKVLVSFHKGRKLQRIFHESIEPNPDYDFSWTDFLQITRTIRQQGYCETIDELNHGLTGIAAPIVHQTRNELLGSLAVVGTSDSFELLRKDAVINLVKETASEISMKVAEN
jgi:DNA-binding IclR family transcriptional regulator